MSLSKTVTVEPLTVVLMTLPQLVAVLSTELTVSEKVKTIEVAVPRGPCRHSTPGVPLSGKSCKSPKSLPTMLNRSDAWPRASRLAVEFFVST